MREQAVALESRRRGGCAEDRAKVVRRWPFRCGECIQALAYARPARQRERCTRMHILHRPANKGFAEYNLLNKY